MTKQKVVFIVDVYAVVSHSEMACIAKNLALCEPVWYKEAVIKAELLKQHPKLESILRDKGWAVDVVEWF